MPQYNTIIKAEAIISDLHDKKENNFSKKIIYINIYQTLSLLGFCLQSLRKSEKWTDIVKARGGGGKSFKKSKK